MFSKSKDLITPPLFVEIAQWLLRIPADRNNRTLNTLNPKTSLNLTLCGVSWESLCLWKIGLSSSPDKTRLTYILQRNYRKMTKSWPFSYNSFVNHGHFPIIPL